MISTKKFKSLTQFYTICSSGGCGGAPCFISLSQLKGPLSLALKMLRTPDALKGQQPFHAQLVHHGRWWQIRETWVPCPLIHTCVSRLLHAQILIHTHTHNPHVLCGQHTYLLLYLWEHNFMNGYSSPVIYKLAMHRTVTHRQLCATAMHNTAYKWGMTLNPTSNVLTCKCINSILLPKPNF